MYLGINLCKICQFLTRCTSTPSAVTIFFVFVPSIGPSIASPLTSSQLDPPKGEDSVSSGASQQANTKATVSSSSGPCSVGTAASSLTRTQDGSVAPPSSQPPTSVSSPVRNGDKQVAKRSLSLSPTRHKHTSHSSSPSPKRRTSQSDRSRSRSPNPKRKRGSTSPKPIISPIKFISSSESHSERSISISPSPPPLPLLASRENGLPRQYRQDYHERKSRHKHRSHKDKRERTRHRERDTDRDRRKHRHRRERDRDYHDVPEREKGHYSGSSISRRDRDFDRDRDYYRKSELTRYR